MLHCRYFCKDMQISLDKKSNIEYLEKEFGLHKFLPKSVLESIKPKVLKKAIQQQFKKVTYIFVYIKFKIIRYRNYYILHLSKSIHYIGCVLYKWQSNVYLSSRSIDICKLY